MATERMEDACMECMELGQAPRHQTINGMGGEKVDSTLNLRREQSRTRFLMENEVELH